MWNRLTVYFLSIVLLHFGPGLASLAYGQTPIFGPEFYARAEGKPQKVVKSFSVQSPNQKFTLYIQNGDREGGKVCSAVIELNGIRVVSPNEFNKQVSTITKPISLQEQNRIAVEVRSEPGTSIVVTILGSLPSEKGIIRPEGGTVNLEGYASVTFPAGAFAESENVTVVVTASPATPDG